MNSIKRMKIGARLALSFALTVVLMGIIGVTGLLSMRGIQENLNHIFAVNLPSLDYVVEADRDLQQLLVAERSMIFADSNSEVFQGLVETYEENLQQAKDRFANFKALITHAEDLQAAADFEAALEEWELLSRQVVEGRISDTRQGRVLAIDLSLGLAADKFEAMRTQLDLLQQLTLADADSASAAAQAQYDSTLLLLLLIIGAGIGIAVLLALIITRGITRQLGGEPADVLEIAGRVADGDLTLDLSARNKGALMALRQMSDSLNEVLSQVGEAVDQVNTGSEQVAQASQSLSQGSTEQASSLEEVTASLNEINSQSTQNSETASEASSVAKGSLQSATGGNEQMQSLIDAMGQINSSSDEISKVVKVIDDIAFQINLLALNANVEAARAGKYGKGFAVVADEVRNLAVRSAEAAKETTAMVEETTRNVDAGNKAAEATATQLEEIVASSTKTADFLEEIALASKEQAQGIEQINQGLSQIDQVTQSNTANAEESAAAAEELASQAQQLRGLVARFKLADRRTVIQAPQSAQTAGGSNGNGRGTNSGETGAPSREPVAVGSPADNRAPNPKDVIKLDDDDFGKF